MPSQSFDETIPETFDLVVFGGTGDLSMRKLMPAMLARHVSQRLPASGRIIGCSRSKLTDQEYRAKVADACETYLDRTNLDRSGLGSFLERLHYTSCDALDPGRYDGLASLLAAGSAPTRVFYLAVSPRLYGPICENLHHAGLLTPHCRVVLEKPIGHDLASSREISAQVGRYFEESQVYRIDHYLGKETVQNLMVLRFANALLEPVWNQQFIDHVQLTVAESIGVEGRGDYYDHSGALRDMIQNHILQVLCLLAMEPPISMTANAIRDEKLKVLRALHPMTESDIRARTVRGQYTRGAIDGQPVSDYAQDLDLDGPSRTESFVALKTEIHNWRWSGVPFYLRTGKRLPTRCSEIVVQFKQVPYRIFPAQSGAMPPNQLVIRLQPNEAVTIQMLTKVPGTSMSMRAKPLTLFFSEAYQTRQPDAYERLLGDVLRGDPTLFMRRDEVDAAWSWVEPILEAWSSMDEPPKSYTAGTWGPTAAIALIERDGRTWHEPS